MILRESHLLIPYNTPETASSGLTSVTSSQLQTHLGFLRAVNELRTKVEGTDWQMPPQAKSLSPEKRWIWFLEMAVERFQSWVENMYFSTREQFLATQIPPIDVWIVWHSYMLNPIWYAEDCDRIPSFKNLGKLSEWHDLTIEALSAMGDLSSYSPTYDQNTQWTDATRVPFDPIECTNILQFQPIVCPKCSQADFAPYLASEDGAEVGYAQSEFKLLCSHCDYTITKQSLAVAKFARDIVRDPSNASEVVNFGNAVFLPGTLHSPTNKANKTRARMIKNSVVLSSAFRNEYPSVQLVSSTDIPRQTRSAKQWEEDIKRKLKFSKISLREELSTRLRPPIIRRILNAYNDDRPFSIDLVGAVLRQGAFVNKMYELGWTRPDFFASVEDRLALEHCITRYHAFLDLIASSPGAFLVPTLDIDLAWHTHQLSPGSYAEYCINHVKRFVNHDDMVEENHLCTSFEGTCKAWQQQFGVPYMHCGCPLPGNTIGAKLLMLKKTILRGHRDVAKIPARNDSYLATHPSDHNSTYIDGVSRGPRQRRLAKTKNRRERDLKNVSAGRLEGEIYRRGDMHNNAFLVPVPMYYYPGGFVGPSGACVVGVGGCTTGGAGGTGCGTSTGFAGVSIGCGSSGLVVSEGNIKPIPPRGAFAA